LPLSEKTDKKIIGDCSLHSYLIGKEKVDERKITIEKVNNYKFELYISYLHTFRVFRVYL